MLGTELLEVYIKPVYYRESLVPLEAQSGIVSANVNMISVEKISGENQHIMFKGSLNLSHTYEEHWRVSLKESDFKCTSDIKAIFWQ